MNLPIIYQLSLILGLTALVRETLARAGKARFPIFLLVRERFTAGSGVMAGVLVGLVAGSLAVLVPFGLSVGSGWLQVRPTGLLAGALAAYAASILAKFLWAGMEELIYRGAVLPQVQQQAPVWVAILVSASLFALGHLGRTPPDRLDFISLTVYALDGIGFGLLAVKTGSLWPPLAWHFTKNLWIWLLYSQGTIQLSKGLFEVQSFLPSLWSGSLDGAGLVDVLVTAALVGVIGVWFVRSQLLRK